MAYLVLKMWLDSAFTRSLCFHILRVHEVLKSCKGCQDQVLRH